MDKKGDDSCFWSQVPFVQHVYLGCLRSAPYSILDGKVGRSDCPMPILRKAGLCIVVGCSVAVLGTSMIGLICLCEVVA